VDHLTLMTVLRHTAIQSALLLGILSVFLTGSLGAASSGRLTALFLDEGGQPLADVFVSLFGRDQDHAFPTLARTNPMGRIQIDGLAAGTYQIDVRSSEYRSPAGRVVEILPERTAVVTLILQQIFALGPEEENLGLKALLRNSNSRRLIFRNQQAPAGSFPDFGEGRGSSKKRRSRSMPTVDWAAITMSSPEIHGPELRPISRPRSIPSRGGSISLPVN
jgi:hypothetical protein